MNYLYPSNVFYDQSSKREVTIMTDARNEVSILTDRLITLRVIGETDRIHGILLRFSIKDETFRITGRDPRGEYASFRFHGSPKELFGYEPDNQITADIYLEAQGSSEPYTYEHIRLCVDP